MYWMVLLTDEAFGCGCSCSRSHKGLLYETWHNYLWWRHLCTHHLLRKLQMVIICLCFAIF